MPLILNGSTGISGTDGSAGTPAVQGTDTNTGMFFPAADQIAFAEGGVEAMRLTAAGDVGIGVTSPVDKLALYNSGAVYQRWQNATTGTGASDGYQLGVDSAGQAFVWQYENQPLVFATNNTERARITSGGNVGIGTSSPASLLQVAGTVRFGAGPSDAANATVALYSDGSGVSIEAFQGNAPGTKRNLWVNGYGGQVFVGTSSGFDVTSGATTQLSGQCAVFAAGSPNTIMSFYNSTQAARVGFIGSNGNSTSYNSGSDYRLKENVTDISGAAAAVQSLRPVTFTWKVSPETGTFSGFIAHELQGVWPEAVVGEKDAICDDGVTPNYQMVDQSKLVPLLTAALQEALTEIAALKTRVAVLEAR